jgi:hypothetical protein
LPFGANCLKQLPYSGGTKAAARWEAQHLDDTSFVQIESDPPLGNEFFSSVKKQKNNMKENTFFFMGTFIASPQFQRTKSHYIPISLRVSKVI